MERVPAGDESHQDIYNQHKYSQYLTRCKCKDQNAEVHSKCILSLPGVKGGRRGKTAESEIHCSNPSIHINIIEVQDVWTKISKYSTYSTENMDIFKSQ